MSEPRAARVLLAAVIMASALLDAALLGRVSEDGAGSTLSVTWWIAGQAGVAALAVVVWLTWLAVHAPALGDWSLPWTRGGEQLRVPMSWPRPGWGVVALTAAYLAATALGVAAAVAVDGLPAGAGIAAWLGLPVLQGFAGLLGFLAALLVAVPVVVLVRTWRPREGRRPAGPAPAIATLLIVAYLLVLPFAVAVALAYDQPERRRPSFGPLWGAREGAIVHSEALLWTARGLGGLMIVLALVAAAMILGRRRRA
ncbi:hypothetical protein [Nocardioides sp.]|uniref:hypothetical protein n=1 Tax=Nocardioides sp. TaxID=35761 RepID=UPI003513152A